MTAAQMCYWQLIDCVRWAPGRIATDDYAKTSVEPMSIVAIQLADDTERAIKAIMNLSPKRL